MKWVRENPEDGCCIWFTNDYIGWDRPIVVVRVKKEYTVRTDEAPTPYPEEKILAGPFKTLKEAKVVYLLLR